VKEKTIPILAVAQTPPPVHGQALMNQYLLEGEYRSIRLHHVRMAFSNDLQEVGSFRPAKLLHLASLIVRIWAARLRTGASVLYYPPAGPNRVPFLRDCALLGLTRPLFKKTVFHFHANGLSTLYPGLPPPLRLLFRWIYGRPDLSIRVSSSGPDDAGFIQSKKIAVVPNCIPDMASGSAAPRTGDRPAILYLGSLFEEKGVLVLLEACAALKSRNVPFLCRLAGRAESPAFAARLEEEVRRLGLESEVELCGQVSGGAKWNLLRQADLLCFPSFYASEGCPLVILEAFQFGLPVVSTRWRGIPDLVAEGETGFLTPPRDPAAVAEALERLAADPALREAMGRKARKHYEEHFRLEHFQTRMEELLRATALD
jgi:glycosyltransferase involved in cell wall biosynthesis